MCARRFVLVRQDHDAVNPPGVVAEGIVFSSGRVALSWTTPPHSLQTFDNIADLMQVQAANHVTRIQWVDSSAQEVKVRSPQAQKLQAAQEILAGMLGSTPVSIAEVRRGVSVRPLGAVVNS